MYQNGKNITIIDHTIHSVEAINDSLRKCKPLTTEQEYDLWLRTQQGDRQACDSLIEANMPYAMRIAKQYMPSGALLEDLFQAGCEGLVLAAHKFDASRGYRFISFATWFVENEVHKAAYDYIDHHVSSLDEPIDSDEEDGKTRIDDLASYPSQSADWNLRYVDTLNALKRQLDERQYGFGRLVGELHHMLCNGYSTSDFARRHRLTESQMNRLLTMLREEANRPHRSAA